MANELVAQFQPSQFQRESSMGHESGLQLAQNPGSDHRGLSLPKLATQGYTTWFIIPASLTMGTGLTLKLPVMDDGTDSADLGKVIRLGITPKLIASGTDEFDLDAAAATETTVDVTLDATTAQVVIGSSAIAAAALDSAAVGGMLAIRIRRIGTHANDTCKGRAILLGAYVLNT